MKKYWVVFMLLLGAVEITAQYIPENAFNQQVDDLVDELASAGIISANQSIKPYSRHQILAWLHEAALHKEVLNARQQKELAFYAASYQVEDSKDGKPFFTKNPLGLQYKDSLFTLSIHPILSGTLYINDSATIQNRFWGGSIYGSIGKHFAFYTVLSDHWETQPLALPNYLTPLTGGDYKTPKDNVGGEFSTIRGGLTWAWKWGQMGFIYDRFVWGSGYHGTNIYSGRTPPFPQLTLKIVPTKWFEFNYIHAWLSSEVLDTARSFTSGNGYKNDYVEKFLAASMFTVKPWKFVRLSFGNSIVYSENHAFPGFLIPTLFYRSVDENFSGINNNSQMFFDLSLRPVKHVHVYGSVYIDDFRLSRIKQSDKYNLYSFKAGFRTSSWPFDNVIITGEYTKTTPITYKHKMDVLTLATNHYTMGHYLRDNSQELYGMIEWRPWQRTAFYGSYTLARHGNEYPYADDEEAVSFPVLKDIIWQNKSLKAGFSYEVFAGTTVKGSVTYSNITGNDADGKTAQYWVDTFTPNFLQGKHVTLEGGFCIGF